MGQRAPVRRRAPVVTWSSRPPRKRTLFPVEDLWLVGPPDAEVEPGADQRVAVSDEMEEELALLEDDAVADVVRAALERGAPAFVAGFERRRRAARGRLARPEGGGAGARPGGLRRRRAGTRASAAEWSVDELVRVIEERR